MSFENVKKYFESIGRPDMLMEFDTSSSTVDAAASTIGCEPKFIAKTLSFLLSGDPILIVTAGDAKIDNKKFKQFFGEKARMISPDLVEGYVGHAPGGVCPFAVKKDVPIYLDVSLKRFDIVYPAAGSGNSAVRLPLDETEKYIDFRSWVDVCKLPE